MFHGELPPVSAPPGPHTSVSDKSKRFDDATGRAMAGAIWAAQDRRAMAPKRRVPPGAEINGLVQM